MRLHQVTFIWLVFLICPCGAAWAEVGTKPGSGNPLDYFGIGNWYGSADPDYMTNNAGYFVYGSIYGNYNDAPGSSGGGNNIIQWYR